MITVQRMTGLINKCRLAEWQVGMANTNENLARVISTVRAMHDVLDPLIREHRRMITAIAGQEHGETLRFNSEKEACFWTGNYKKRCTPRNCIWKRCVEALK